MWLPCVRMSSSGEAFDSNMGGLDGDLFCELWTSLEADTARWKVRRTGWTGRRGVSVSHPSTECAAHAVIEAQRGEDCVLRDLGGIGVFSPQRRMCRPGKRVIAFGKEAEFVRCWWNAMAQSMAFQELMVEQCQVETIEGLYEDREDGRWIG